MFAQPLEQLSRAQFIRTWSAVSYLFPGLHPDAYDDADSGWPRALKRFAAEAWRRADAGELADEELYCCDAQWSGLYDRMHTHEPDEMERLAGIGGGIWRGRVVQERGSVSRSTSATSKTLKTSNPQRNGEATAGRRPALRGAAFTPLQRASSSTRDMNRRPNVVRELKRPEGRAPAESVSIRVHPWLNTTSTPYPGA